jgi:DNA-binding beta-propeller fold protein YncE
MRHLGWLLLAVLSWWVLSQCSGVSVFPEGEIWQTCGEDKDCEGIPKSRCIRGICLIGGARSEGQELRQEGVFLEESMIESEQDEEKVRKELPSDTSEGGTEVVSEEIEQVADRQDESSKEDGGESVVEKTPQEGFSEALPEALPEAVKEPSCPQSEVLCGGRCVNTDQEPEHCGGCGKDCRLGVCTNGNCNCAGGALGSCGGNCVDLSRHNAHCGGCGNACAAGQGCLRSLCRPLPWTDTYAVSNQHLLGGRGLTSAPTGELFVAEYATSTITRIDTSGQTSVFAGVRHAHAHAGGTPGRLYHPYDILFHPTKNMFYIADALNNRIRAMTPQGSLSTVAGDGRHDFRDGAAAQASFRYPWGLALDVASEKLYIADTYSHCLRVLDLQQGQVTTLAGKCGTPGLQGGAASDVRFRFPIGLAYRAGVLYIADSDNHCIRRVEATGQVTTFAGTCGSYGTSEGMVGIARFYFPRGIAFDDAGNLYVAEEINRRIRKVEPSGRVSTLTGAQKGALGLTAGYDYVDGSDVNARFRTPWGIHYRAGRLYVTEHASNAVRRITLP